MKEILRRALVALGTALLMTAIIGAGALKRVDRWTQDALFQRQGVPSSDIVIIGIDELALDVFGPYNTWDRNIMASALEKLAEDPEKRPAVVAIDILYAGTTFDQADKRLADAASALNCVVTASMAEFGDEITWSNGHAIKLSALAVKRYLEPYEELRDVTRQGHINAVYDTDGIMRHTMLSLSAPDGRQVNSMAYEVARAYCLYHDRSFSAPSAKPGSFFYIPYTSKPGGYSDSVSLAMLIAGQVPPDYWSGKIVLIGPYTTALQDGYYTSIEHAEQMFGVEIQANIVQCLLSSTYRTDVSDALQLAMAFVLFFVCAMLYQTLNPIRGGLLCLGAVSCSLGGSVLLYRLGYVTHPLWLAGGGALLYIASLAYHYARAVRERHRLELEKQRVDAELALATRIQLSALVKDFPVYPDRREFDVYASMKPAKEVGGDFYDVFMSDQDHLTLVIGDVSGKGVPAALFMMLSTTLLRHVAMRELNPARALMTLNEEICARNPAEMFVTVWVGVLEISTGRLVCANAGHEYPALKAADGSFDLIKDRHGLVVGGMEGVRYREYELSMKPGDKLFVYTDGVAEATDAHEQMFGTERMISALSKADDSCPKDILLSVSKAVDEFVGKAPQFDDLTMLCLQYNGVSSAVENLNS